MEDVDLYGIIGKMRAQPGQRDQLIEILQSGLKNMPGCLSYIVAKDPADADGIWITEVWDSKESHGASLSLPSVQQAIARGKPMIAGFEERFETEPVGGHGLTVGGDDLREFATRYTTAWCSHDAERVAAFFAKDGSLSVNGTVAKGRDAITAVAAGFMSAFPDMLLTMDSLDVGRDATVYHWTLAGTNTGPNGTGKTVRISGYEEWLIGEDGLIARSSGHFDEEEYRHQLEHGVG